MPQRYNMPYRRQKLHGQFNNRKEEYDMKDLEVKYLWELVADFLII